MKPINPDYTNSLQLGGFKSNSSTNYSPTNHLPTKYSYDVPSSNLKKYLESSQTPNITYKILTESESQKISDKILGLEQKV
jgi:hypothetical protein